MKSVGLVGWRGMVGPVLVARRRRPGSGIAEQWLATTVERVSTHPCSICRCHGAEAEYPRRRIDAEAASAGQASCAHKAHATSLRPAPPDTAAASPTARSPPAAAARPAELADACTEATDWGSYVCLGRARVEFANAADFTRRFSGAHAPAAASFAGLSVRVADVGAVQRLLEAAAVPYRVTPQGVLWVPPQVAAGAIIEFVA
jgi:hypothetical protein